LQDGLDHVRGYAEIAGVQLRKDRLGRGNQTGLPCQTNDRCCAGELETQFLSHRPASSLIDQQQRLAA